MDDPFQIVTDLTVGQLSNTYTFFGQIGSGGMGVIYKARHAMLNKDVAIKILHQVNELSVQRFQREAQAAYNLHHENVVAVHEFGVTEHGQPFMVMEFIDGKTLSKIIDERGALPIELCITIFKQVCKGISHAHSRGVLHRDLKPSNIMLAEPDSWSPHVRIVDFGIAKVMDTNDLESGKLTMTGDFVGSPLYMSPEQCLGKNVDLRSDIYSVGCIMFEALTGKPPLQGETMMETMLKQMHDKAPTLKEGSGGNTFPVWIERLVARALAKDPEERFQTIDELAKAIEDRVVGAAKSVSKKDGTAAGKKSLSIPLIATAAVALLVVAGVSVFFLKEPPGKANAPSKMPSEALIEQFPELKKKKSDGRYNDFIADPTILSPPTHDQIIARDVADREQTKISSQRQAINDSALSGLKDRVDVTELELAGSKISDKALEPVKHLPLVKVDLSDNAKITTKVLSYIKPEFLEELNLNKTGVNGSAALAKFRNLRSLSLASDQITDASLAGISKLTGLVNLDLSDNANVTDAAMKVISKFPKLRQLNLAKTGISGKGLAELKDMHELSVVSAQQTRVDDQAVQAIQNLPLTSLHLQNTNISDKCIATIVKIKNLRNLGLENVLLSPTSIKSIADLPLYSLDLAATGVDNAGLVELSRCSTLRELELSGNRHISGVGIKALAKLPLQQLVLYKTSITDNDLPLFYNWKDLRQIDFTGCGVSQPAIDRLRTTLHNDCAIFPYDKPNITKINWGAAL